MEICKSIEHFRSAHARLSGASLGLVPTMGYLHAGHMALVQAAAGENEYVAASIFVNPTQFNNPEDLAKYPRNEARDLQMLQDHGVALVLLPPPEEMYPPGFQTYVHVENITRGLEGEHRPGHFRGVATVVTKLFNITQPQRAYFGQKDAQQVTVIQRMVHDLNIPVEIVVCPTVREADGLAMSSRNARLSPPERAAAAVLHKALMAAKSLYDAGEGHPDLLRQAARKVLNDEPLASPEYISAADANTLEELENPIDTPILLSMAVFIGETRLIDNVVLGHNLNPG